MDLHLLGADSVFGSADALRHGLDSHALRRLVREGRCAALTRGWYAVTDPAHATLTPEHRHRLTALALGRQFARRAAVSHHSLVLLHELPTWSVDLSTVHLTSTLEPTAGDRGVASRRRGLVIHRPITCLTGSVTAGGSRTVRSAVSLGQAIVQTGLLSGPESALVPADAALARRLVTRPQLAEAALALSGRHGIGPVRAALVHADRRHESPGETRAAYLLRALGHELDPQVEIIAEGRRYRADLRIRGTRVLVEFDGRVKYSERTSLFDEKLREDALRRAGWVVVRLVWADLARPELVRRRLLDALRLAA